MTAMKKPKSDAVILKEFFGGDQKASDFLAELKKLSAEEKVQLAGGIRDGSMTY